MSFVRGVRRRLRRDGRKAIAKAAAENRPHVLMSSHTEQIIALRSMDRSPSHDDGADPLEYRRAKNRRKRARRASR